MKCRLHRRFLPACEGALEKRLVLSTSTLTSDVVPMNGAGPQLVSVGTVQDGRGRITKLEVHYDSPMDPASAGSAYNFQVTSKTVRGRRMVFGGYQTVVSASYDPVQETTTLVLKHPVASRTLYVRPGSANQLVVSLMIDSLRGTDGSPMQGHYRALVS